jgi:alkylation response protein AidB-like acyl-CoA dehydrogenase
VLNQQPLMQNVLADLVLEHEGSLALTMRMARALDHRDDDPMKSCWPAWSPPWASTGSASARRSMPTRRWNASAAAA